MPLDVLIQEAWGDNPDQSWVLRSMTGHQRASWKHLCVLDEPEWVKSDRFDITARYIPSGEFWKTNPSPDGAGSEGDVPRRI